MPRPIVLGSASSNRRQPLLPPQSPQSNRCTRFGETAGSTTAECAAVICCCPCSLVNLVVLAAYRVPAGLCRRALRQCRRHKFQKKKDKAVRSGSTRCRCGCDDTDVQIHPFPGDVFPEVQFRKTGDFEKEVMELELEMWQRFYGTGFWRSPSQRESFVDAAKLSVSA